MGLLDKLFGSKKKNDSKLTEIVTLQKGEAVVSTGDNNIFKVIRSLTDKQKDQIRESTILLRTGQLYMHYQTEYLESVDRTDQEWQNRVMFFWEAEEPFEKKSLPAHFETFVKMYFLFCGDTSKINLKVAQAVPRFDMPGLGNKYVCEISGEEITIPELSKLGLVEYIEMVELTDDNQDILTNKDDYFFLVDDRITPFENGNFYLRGEPITIDVAYSIGGIHIIKKQ